MKDERIKVLLAEDNTNLGVILREFLIAKGFDVTLCEDGEVAYDTFTKKSFDICVLDVVMPKKDGFLLAEEMKNFNQEIPIIFLTAKNQPEDVLRGLRLGADDYMHKPFSMEELILRIEAIMRRVRGVRFIENRDIFKIKSLEFNYKKQVLISKDIEIKLTTKESELLRLLSMNANKILERKYALKYIWNDNNYFNARSMDVYITKLRKHLKQDPEVQIINVHRKGYKLIM